MFPEFLHPDAVLFGEPINPEIKCKHPFIMRDGEIVVHQTILRTNTATLPMFKLPSGQFKRQKNYSEEQQNADNDVLREDDEDKPLELPRNKRFEDEEEEEESSSQEDYEDIPNYQHNPFVDQLEGVPIDVAYLPEQLDRLISTKNMKNSKNKKVPFSSKQKIEGEEEKEEWLNGGDGEEESWVTEQEEEQYLINEQLEEVSGNFAMEVGAGDVDMDLNVD